MKQKEFQLSKARDHLKSMKEFDLQHPFYNGCFTNRDLEKKIKKFYYTQNNAKKMS